MQYRDAGYLPHALLNYLVRLGWSHGDREVFTLAEMTQLFDIHDVNKSAAAFNPEKLLWLNQQHIMRAAPELLARYLKPQLAAIGIDVVDDVKIAAVAHVMRERAKTLQEMAQTSRYFFVEPQGYDEKAAKKNLTAEAVRPLTVVIEKLAALTDWRAAAIHDIVNLTASELQIGLGKVAQPIRVAVSGTAVSPPIDGTLEVLGREATLARLQRAVDYAARQ
jgi:glutamyl-tRNA synthetase